MAILKSASKIASRPQIKAVKQPIPRQVILPKKAQPVAKPIAKPIAKPVAKAPARPLIAPPLPSLPRQPIAATSVGGIPQSDMQSIMNRLQQLQNNFNNTNQGTNVSPAQPAPAMADFNSYGFDRGLVDYLNNQRQLSGMDAGVSYNYDPATQTFTGGTMGGPVTMTLAQMQAQAQNYQNRPVYNPRVNPRPIVGQSSVGSIGYPAGGGTTTYDSTGMPVLGAGGVTQYTSNAGAAPISSAGYANFIRQQMAGFNPSQINDLLSGKSSLGSLNQQIPQQTFNQQQLPQQLGMQPQLGGFGQTPQFNRQIPQEMIDANAREAALTALQPPTNYGSRENMMEMKKSQMQGVGNYGGVPEDIQKIQIYAGMGIRPITQTEDMRIAAQQLGGPSVMPQQGGVPQSPTSFYQGGPRGGVNPYTTDYTRPAGSDIAGFSAFNPMFNPMVNPMYNAPMPNNMNQQGFVPMGGNNPQNTSYGSFGAIQQPMGGFGNIGSLLGMG